MSTVEPTKQYEGRGVNAYAQELLKRIGERDDTIAQLRAERGQLHKELQAWQHNGDYTIRLGVAAATEAITKEHTELMAKLAQVEADAAAMREALELARHQFIRSNASNLDELKTMPTPYDAALKPGSGQALLDELATLRATAQRRLELLQNWKWPKDKCPWCGCGPAQLGHRPDCPLAKELEAK